MTDPTPLEQAQETRDDHAHNIAASHETGDDDKTPLERAREQTRRSAQNLAEAREESLEAHSKTREQENVDTHTDAPGGIGKSGQAPNPRTQPTRDTR